MKSHKINISIAVPAAIMLAASIAFSAGTDLEKELLVYSIEHYGQQYDANACIYRDWKSAVPFSAPSQSPYDDLGLWGALYSGCTGWNCAMEWNGTDGSLRKKDESVSVNKMARFDNGWQDADMVFFFGHNTQIQPQWPYEFDLWRPTGRSQQFYQAHINDWQVWGTEDEPYRYHRNFIDDASYTEAYSVFYAYNPLTSILIGEDFTDGTWYTENTKNGSATGHNWMIGPETEWVFGHGCNAVTVADYIPVPSSSCTDALADCNSDEGCWDGKCQRVMTNSLGVSAWKKSWNKLHMVLGHYHGTYMSMEPNLMAFGIKLKDGWTVKDAYFDVHDCVGWDFDDKDYGPALCQPAVIAQSPKTCCLPCGTRTCCPLGGCDGDFMHHDKWTAHDPDLNEDFYYSTDWIVGEQ